MMLWTMTNMWVDSLEIGKHCARSDPLYIRIPIFYLYLATSVAVSSERLYIVTRGREVSQASLKQKTLMRGLMRKTTHAW